DWSLIAIWPRPLYNGELGRLEAHVIKERILQMSKKGVYLFREGNATMRDLLGGKGANLAEMTNIGLPVPPGFTITTEMCNEYIKTGKLPDGLMTQVQEALGDVEREMGKKLGDPANP